jgi:hypothetical protein
MKCPGRWAIGPGHPGVAGGHFLHVCLRAQGTGVDGSGAVPWARAVLTVDSPAPDTLITTRTGSIYSIPWCSVPVGIGESRVTSTGS